MTTLGSRVPMLEGGERVRGQARYTADITVPGMLHARPVLSPHAHAAILSIDKTAALAVRGVVAVLAAGDLAVRFAGVTRAHMLLAQERVIFCGQPVAVVVAETEAAAEDGAAAVTVDYDPLPASVDLESAIAPGAPLVWPAGLPATLNPDDAAHGTVAPASHPSGGTASNAGGDVEVTRGDVAQGLRQADLVLENTYRTRIVHQGYLEPNASLAQPDPVTGGMTVYSATQAQFMVRDKVAQILNLPVSKVRVVTLAVGGAFGGKFGIIDPLVAAVAWTLRRPVRMVLTRSEDFLLTTPAPQMVIRVKTGMTKMGALTAVDADILVDSGSHPTALAGLAAHAFGTAYKVPHLRARARGAVTHKPAVGSYRGPGGPQATFALESQIDEMARRLGLDPLAVRLQNAVDEGDPMTDGGRYPAVGLKTCLRRLAAHPLWTGRTSTPGIGYGLAAAGWLGTIMPACATCAMDADGTLTITVGSTDMTGAHTTMALIAADVFNVSSERVRIVPTDTGGAAYAGPSAGSMVTRTVGAAVLAAAKSARRQLIDTAAAMLEANPNDLVLDGGGVEVRGAPDRRLSYQEIAGRTRSYNSPHPPISAEGTVALRDIAPCFIVELTRVRVDPDTGAVRVLDWVIVQDVGRALNPLLIEGQIHGGVTQSQGLALWEQLAYDEDGRLLSGTLADYALSKAADVPPITVDLVEVPAQGSPFGARGVGEPSIIPGAAAIANAVRDACGARVTSLPITPQALWKSLQTMR